MATFKDLLSAIISKLNCKVASVNGTTPDENGNVEVQSGVQSDWNENNETSPAFVKNRPFYTGEAVLTEIIPEQTYTMSSNGPFTVYSDRSGTYPYSLEPGKEYTVVYNGTTYELTSNTLEGIAYVGDSNPMLTGSEPTMPFVIAAGNGILQIFDYTGNTEVTFKISGYKVDIKQIDLKYIPNLPKYMAKENPVGYGSFSLNRKADTTVGVGSHAEGDNTTASGSASHAEGNDTTASGVASHAEGNRTIASELTSHAEGYDSEANARFSHAEGFYTIVSTTDMSVPSSQVEEGMGRYGHAEGFCTLVTGGHGAHAEGCKTKSSGNSSHAEGDSTIASGKQSHAEGFKTVASGAYSHSEGDSTTASGGGSHAEGFKTVASGAYSHAEGSSTKASGTNSHAEGSSNEASGTNSHTEGYETRASGHQSHAEGYETRASGTISHAEGKGTVASSNYQHVQGKFNIEDSAGVYAHIVGNGDSSTKRSNCHTIDWNGNAWFSGTIEGSSIIIPSSTAGSTKKFKITVDDSGTISATEVTG